MQVATEEFCKELLKHLLFSIAKTSSPWRGKQLWFLPNKVLWVVRVKCSPNGLLGKCLPTNLLCLFSVFRLQDKCKVQYDKA